MAEGMTRAALLVVLVAAAISGLLSFGVAPARACDADNQHTFGVAPGCVDVRISAAPTAGDLAPDYFQAGGHPYEVVTAIRVNAPFEADPIHGIRWPPEPLKDLRIDLPPGLVANPQAVPPCDVNDLVGIDGNPTCAPDAQVGIVSLELQTGPKGAVIDVALPLFRVATPAGAPPRFGFNALGIVSMIDSQQSRDGGLSILIKNLGEVVSPVGLTFSLWGVPGDPGHTPERSCPGQPSPLGSPTSTKPGPACSATLSPRALLRLPTRCGSPASLGLSVASWTQPGKLLTTTVQTHAAPGLLGDPGQPLSYPAPYPGLDSDQWGPSRGFSGCDHVPFHPTLKVRSDNGRAGGPSGLDVEVSLPQAKLDDPAVVAEADLEAGSVELPAGFAINPSVANGLTLCTPEEANLDSQQPASCPDSSKLGTVGIESPLVDTPMTGAIYAARSPGDQSQQTTVSTYIVAEAAGFAVKLPSELSVDSGDGRLKTSFGPVSQLPISNIRLRFFGGDRAPFVAPALCGPHSVDAELRPWSGGATVRLRTTIDGAADGCVTSSDRRPFVPRLAVALSDPRAGAPDSLAIRLTRDDDEQEPNSFEFTLPEGFSASLGGVVTCTAVDLAACPDSSRVGSLQAAAGAGSEPFQLQGGKVFLTGPYEGANHSLATVLPANLGPIALDPLVMRLPLRLDRSDGRMIVGGRLPSPPAGMRLNLRQLTITVDRPGFLSNPTKCQPSAVSGRVSGDGGATAAVSAPLQIVGCAGLPFGPRLGMRVLPGRGATRHGGHPALRLVLSRPAGDANLESSTISFPVSQQLDATHLGTICRVEGPTSACPPKTIYGHVKVFSPLFDDPVSGSVYLRRSEHRLPDLVTVLSDPLDFDLEGRLGFAHGRMRVTLGPFPDLPVSKVVMTVAGGKRGLFINNRNLCRSRSSAAARLSAQNGKVVKRRPRLRVSCGRATADVTRNDSR